MVAILLAAARIAAGGLQVALRIGADPYAGIGRWNSQGIDAADHSGVAYLLASRIEINKALALASSGEAVATVAGIA